MTWQKNRHLVWIAVLWEFKAKEKKRKEEKWAVTSYINKEFWSLS